MSSSCTTTGRICLVGIALGLGGAACSGGAGLGGTCSSHSDCADSLQCFDHTCVARCTRNSDCGDGHVCSGSGTCDLSTKQEGDACDSEYVCAPGLSCQLADEDIDGDGFLTSSCQPENSGGVLADPCDDDDECRTGTCVLGRCVDVCAYSTECLPANTCDCPVDHTCTEIPRGLDGIDDTFASFRGCLPAAGNLEFQLPISQPYTHFLLPVPANARSVALVAEIDESDQLVGAAYLEEPRGEGAPEVVYTLPYTREEYFANVVRSDLAKGSWTLVLPQSPDVPLKAGAYVVELGSYLDHLTPGTEVPRVSAIYKLDDRATLDLHFYFLDLASHPCAGTFLPASAPLDAETAPAYAPFNDVFLHDLRIIINSAGIAVGSITYDDIEDRPDLDGLDEEKLGDLLSLSTHEGGISVFFVRTISPSGIQALVGGPPAPPGLPGTRGSGVAVALDTLCYRDWSVVARITAHEIARALGLHRTVEPDGYTDPIDDSGFDSDNLMYFNELGGDAISNGQEAILRRSPALR